MISSTHFYSETILKNKPLKSAKSGFFYGKFFEFSRSEIGVFLRVCSWFVRVSFESSLEKYHKLRTSHEQT